MSNQLDNDLINPGGILTEEQIKRFVNLICFPEQMLRAREARVRCFRCGVSWPWLAPELCCTCAPNEVRDHIRKHGRTMYFIFDDPPQVTPISEEDKKKMREYWEKVWKKDV